jgi:hypothetical protein
MNIPANKIKMLQANNFVSSEQIHCMKYKVIKTQAIIFAKV